MTAPFLLHMDELTTSLKTQEKIIKKGLETFYIVGQALLVIRDEKLYKGKYDTFEAYCSQKWDISRSQGYNLIDAGIVAGSVTGELPDRITHVAPLKRIKTEALREKALSELNELPVITGDFVHEIVQKYVLIESESPLGEKLLQQTITPRKAVKLEKRLTQLPPYYRESVYQAGLGGEAVSPVTLTAIRALEYEFEDEALDILRSGYLDDTPLYELHESQVRGLLRRLRYELSQTQAIEVSDDQKSQAPFQILRGHEVFDRDPNKSALVLPDGIALENLKINPQYIIVLGNQVNFDGTVVNTKNLTNVVPQSVLTLMENLCELTP